MRGLNGFSISERRGAKLSSMSKAPRKLLILSIPVIMFLTACLAFWGVEVGLTKTRGTFEETLLNRLKYDISAAVDSLIEPGKQLATLMAGNHGLGESVVQELSERIIRENPCVKGIAIAPEAVVQRYFPESGNESLIGHDLLTNPERRESLALAVESRKPVVSGPFSSVDGIVFFIRYPVFQQEKIWGFVSLTVSLDEFERSMNLEQRYPGIHITIARSKKGFAGYSRQLALDGETWDIAIQSGAASTKPMVALGLLFLISLSASVLLFLYLRQKSHRVASLPSSQHGQSRDRAEMLPSAQGSSAEPSKPEPATVYSAEVGYPEIETKQPKFAAIPRLHAEHAAHAPDAKFSTRGELSGTVFEAERDTSANVVANIAADTSAALAADALSQTRAENPALETLEHQGFAANTAISTRAPLPSPSNRAQHNYGNTQQEPQKPVSQTKRDKVEFLGPEVPGQLFMPEILVTGNPAEVFAGYAEKKNEQRKEIKSGSIPSKPVETATPSVMEEPKDEQSFIELKRSREAVQPQPLELDFGKEKSAADIRILVVDDSEANRDIMGRMLALRKHSAEFASSGEEARARCSAEKFNLIFMDCFMPGMDGYKTARMLREQKLADQSIIIGMSAKVGQRELDLCIEAGMDDLLSKPFTISELESRIKKHFDSV